MRTKWLNDEIELLKELYLNDGLSLIELLPFFLKKYDRSEESIRIKIKRLKLRHTEQQKKDIKSRLNSGNKNGMFGKESPLKGLTKENSELIRLKSEKLSKIKKRMYSEGLLPDIRGEKNPMFGKTPWNFGLNKYNNASIKIGGEKTSKARKLAWLIKTPEEREKIVLRLNDAMIQRNKPTKIEIKMENFLIDENIEFIKNYKIGLFLVDFYLPQHNLIIECDGDYWHANPNFVKNKELTKPQLQTIDRDIRKNEELIKRKIRFLRFWEWDINNNFNDVKSSIKKNLE
jgi:very-short-patch-repair endonuclease